MMFSDTKWTAAGDWHGLLLSFGSAADPGEMATALENVGTVVSTQVIKTSHKKVFSPQQR